MLRTDWRIGPQPGEGRKRTLPRRRIARARQCLALAPAWRTRWQPGPGLHEHPPSVTPVQSLPRALGSGFRRNDGYPVTPGPTGEDTPPSAWYPLSVRPGELHAYAPLRRRPMTAVEVALPPPPRTDRRTPSGWIPPP